MKSLLSAGFGDSLNSAFLKGTEGENEHGETPLS